MMETAKVTSSNQRRLKLILLNVCVGQFIVGLDQRALLVALPTLTETFNTSLTTIQWVLLIYDLLLIGTVITVGLYAYTSRHSRTSPAAGSCTCLVVPQTSSAGADSMRAVF